jgi:hypothetical protein
VIALDRQPRAAVPRRRSLKALLCLSTALLLWTSACFNTSTGNEGGFKSFLGIHFGDSFKDTRAYYPQGLTEASPLGYAAYHIQNVSSESIQYTDVIYEFDGIKGMQVVFARFAPASADAVLERLRRLLGEPTQHTLTQDQRMAEALWLTPGGEEIRFDRVRHLLIVIGPEGAKLRKDVDLRLENSPAIY